MRVLLTGATGQIGGFMLPRLRDAGIEVVAHSRNPHDADFGEQWIVGDLRCHDPFEHNGSFDVWVHLGFLSLTTSWFKSAQAAGVTRFVSFSSTSIFTKSDSSSGKERQIIAELIDAERGVMEGCEAVEIAWTILRPTMIYGAGRDQNVAFVETMIRRFGVFPLVGGGLGKRMPVHADDLAWAAFAAMQREAAKNRSYNLGGGEILAYRQFVEKIFTRLGKPARILSLSLPCARLIAKLVAVVPGFGHVTPAMFERMMADLVFDYSDAVRDLDYHPRCFMCDSGEQQQ